MPIHRPPRFTLLACDLDGTLMGDNTTIGSRVYDALAAAQARGVTVTLATGRGFAVTLPYAHQLNIKVPIICYQGGVIKNPTTCEVLYQATMEQADVLNAIELSRSRSWHLVVYIDEALFIEEQRHPRKFYDDLLGANLQYVDDLAATVRANPQNPSKFLIVVDGADAGYVQMELRKQFGHRVDIVRSHDLFVEGNPPGVNKGDALRRLSSHLGVPRQQVMAIGDQGNDAPMLQWAGLGVAMGSGSDEARCAANWIAPSLSDDGAAVAVERFLLE